MCLQVGVEGGVDSAMMKRLDKHGFDIRVSKGSDSGILRIPFREFSLAHLAASIQTRIVYAPGPHSSYRTS